MSTKTHERSHKGAALVLAGVVLLAHVGGAAASTSWKDQRQKDKADARGLVAAAKALESQSKFEEAHEKYTYANIVSPSGEAKNGIKRTAQKVVAALVLAADKRYQAADYQSAIDLLKKAEVFSADSPMILQDLAACYNKIGDRQIALNYLDRMKAALPEHSPEQLKVDQLRSLVITGETASDVPPDFRAVIVNVNGVLRARLRSPGEIKNYREVEADQEKIKCKALADNEARLPRTGPVLFNLAKCAQEEGRFEDANQYFSSYLKLAPKSMDLQDVQLRLQDIQPLLSLKDEKGEQVRSLFVEAYRDILGRKYGAALHVYQRAEQILPDYPQTKYKLGMLYASIGDFLNADRYLHEYVRLENNEDAKKAVTSIIEALPANKTHYDQHVEVAKDILLGRSSSGVASSQQEDAEKNGEASPLFAINPGQLPRAIEELNKAVAIFPLAYEANTLLAYAYLNGNNPEAARLAMDTVWGGGEPVFFYARVQSPVKFPSGPLIKASLTGGLTGRSDLRAFLAPHPDPLKAKVEITNAELRIVFLERPGPAPAASEPKRSANEQMKKVKKRKVVEVPTIIPSKAGTIGDKMANVAGDSRALLQSDTADVLTIPLQAIRSVATQGNSIIMTVVVGEMIGDNIQFGWSSGKDVRKAATQRMTLRLFPIVAFNAPDQGWPARRFVNAYTRMLSQYLGFDGVKLGPEHLSAGEKLAIAGMIALIAASYGSASFQAASSIGKILSAGAGVLLSVSVVQQKILSDRRQAQPLDFKIIPESMELSFHADNFK